MKTEVICPNCEQTNEVWTEQGTEFSCSECGQPFSLARPKTSPPPPPPPPSELPRREYNNKLTQCPACGQMISTKARACPDCGHDCRDAFGHYLLATLFILAGFGATFSGCTMETHSAIHQIYAQTQTITGMMLIGFGTHFALSAKR